MAPPDDVTSENKWHTLDAVCPKYINTELPKKASEPWTGTAQIAG